MSSHGHVNPRPDGAKARCGGPGVCGVCSREQALKDRGLALHAGDRVEVHEPHNIRTATVKTLGNATGPLVVVPDKLPADAPVDILLPPEPPRTRVIEALDADGVVRMQVAFRNGTWFLHDDYESAVGWSEVVADAIADGHTLRHRADESGGES